MGKQGEEAACQFLEARGYRILDRNFRTRFAEIDIIAEYEETVIFIEVRTRRSARYGSPGESVGRAKQKKIITGAMQYLREKSLHDYRIRFDIVTLLLTGETSHIEHIPHAFHG